MNNMKKLLALVLALVMTMGLATVGAGAALDDQGTGDVETLNVTGTTTLSGTATYKSITVKDGGDLIITKTAKVTTTDFTAEKGSSVTFVRSGEDALKATGDVSIQTASIVSNEANAGAFNAADAEKVEVIAAAAEAVKAVADDATDTKIGTGTTNPGTDDPGEEPTGDTYTLTIKATGATSKMFTSLVVYEDGTTTDLVKDNTITKKTSSSYTTEIEVASGTKLFICDSGVIAAGYGFTATYGDESEILIAEKYNADTSMYGLRLTMPAADTTILQSSAQQLATVVVGEGLTLTKAYQSVYGSGTEATLVQGPTENSNGSSTYLYSTSVGSFELTSTGTTAFYTAAPTTTAITNTAIADGAKDVLNSEGKMFLTTAIAKGATGYLYPAVQVTLGAISSVTSGDTGGTTINTSQNAIVKVGAKYTLAANTGATLIETTDAAFATKAADASLTVGTKNVSYSEGYAVTYDADNLKVYADAEASKVTMKANSQLLPASPAYVATGAYVIAVDSNEVGTSVRNMKTATGTTSQKIVRKDEATVTTVDYTKAQAITAAVYLYPAVEITGVNAQVLDTAEKATTGKVTLGSSTNQNAAYVVPGTTVYVKTAVATKAPVVTTDSGAVNLAVTKTETAQVFSFTAGSKDPTIAEKDFVVVGWTDSTLTAKYAADANGHKKGDTFEAGSTLLANESLSFTATEGYDLHANDGTNDLYKAAASGAYGLAYTDLSGASVTAGATVTLTKQAYVTASIDGVTGLTGTGITSAGAAATTFNSANIDGAHLYTITGATVSENDAQLKVAVGAGSSVSIGTTASGGTTVTGVGITAGTDDYPAGAELTFTDTGT